MLRIADAKARKLGLRVYTGPTRKLSPLAKLRQYEQETGYRIVKQILWQLKNYPCANRQEYKITKFTPVPRPDYELKYGGPYTHIIHAFYCKDWCCVFGLRADGEVVLWMD